MARAPVNSGLRWFSFDPFNLASAFDALLLYGRSSLGMFSRTARKRSPDFVSLVMNVPVRECVCFDRRRYLT